MTYSYRNRRQHGSDWYPTQWDLDLYADMAFALGGQPNGPIFRYVSGAEHLVFLHEAGRHEWGRVIAAAERRWRDLPTRGPIASDGTHLESLPERLVYETLGPLVDREPDLALDLHPRLPSRGGAHWADFAIRSRDRVCYLEVVGCCGSDRITRNAEESWGVAQFEAREAVYAGLGITPQLVFLDGIADPARLQTICARAVNAVNETRHGSPDDRPFVRVCNAHGVVAPSVGPRAWRNV